MTRPSVITNDYRRRAQQATDRYQAELSAIDHDQDLTPQARIRRKQEAYERTKSEVDGLRRAESGERDGRRRNAERRLFGLGPDPTSADQISLRDALDRASGIELDGAASAMRQAIRSGDRTLAKAILSRALQIESAEAVQTYLAEYPEDHHLVDDLQTDDDGMLGMMAYMVVQP